MSHSNGPINARIASRVLFPSTIPFQFLYILGLPFRSPRVPIGQPATRPLPNFSCFRSKLTEKGRAHRTPRTVRADVTGRIAALLSREGALPVGGYKRAKVRARPAQCGRHPGRAYLRTQYAAVVRGGWEQSGAAGASPGPQRQHLGPPPRPAAQRTQEGGRGDPPPAGRSHGERGGQAQEGGGRPPAGGGGVSGAFREPPRGLEGPPGGPGLGMCPQASQ